MKIDKKNKNLLKKILYKFHYNCIAFFFIKNILYYNIIQIQNIGRYQLLVKLIIKKFIKTIKIYYNLLKKIQKNL